MDNISFHTVKYSVSQKLYSNLKHLLNNVNKCYTIKSDCPDWFVLNNNNLYFLYILPRSHLEKNKRDTLLYFFTLSDQNKEFCLEIDHDIKLPCGLYKGYLYNTQPINTFSIVDILTIWDDGEWTIPKIGFSQRRRLIDTITGELYSNLNLNITLTSHRVYQSKFTIISPQTLISFAGASTLTHVEYISEDDFCSSENICVNETDEKKEATFRIEKYDDDVYKLYDNVTNEYNGHLYIKTLSESLHLQSIFKETDWIIGVCKNISGKWVFSAVKSH